MLNRKPIRITFFAAGLTLLLCGIAADATGMGPGRGFGHVQFSMILLGTFIVFLFSGKQGGTSARFSNLSIILMNTILLLLVIELLSTHYIGRHPPEVTETHAGTPAEEGDRRVLTNWYYQPYVLYTAAPGVVSESLSTDSNGFRSTPGADDRAFRDGFLVYCFGGSTMWGWGMPDTETIPAYLQKRLSENLECPVAVVNMGAPGWMSTQELFQLVICLWEGGRPDLVIFYDSGNDLGSCAAGLRGENPRRDFVENALNGRFIREIDGGNLLSELFLRLNTGILLSSMIEPGQRDPAVRMMPVQREETLDSDRITEEMLTTMLGNYRIALALADRYDFECIFAWHPLLAASEKPMSDAEQEWLCMEASDSTGFNLIRNAFRTGPAALTEAGLPGFEDLSGALDSCSLECFVDACHLNGVGNSIIADSLFSIILATGHLDSCLVEEAGLNDR